MREVKVYRMTRLVNRYDAGTCGVVEHGISFQNQTLSETMVSCFDEEVELCLVQWQQLVY